mgnify:CR=1 FL=1
MTVTFKLYASLMRYLPEGAADHKIELQLSEPTSPLQLLERYAVPQAQVHLVLINGVYIPPAERDRPLCEGDELAVWPAIAGG